MTGIINLAFGPTSPSSALYHNSSDPRTLRNYSSLETCTSTLLRRRELVLRCDIHAKLLLSYVRLIYNKTVQGFM